MKYIPLIIPACILAICLGSCHGVTEKSIDIPADEYRLVTLHYENSGGELGLTHLRKHQACTLSGGERRRLEITRALITSPALIMLDEPFSGVDPKAV